MKIAGLVLIALLGTVLTADCQENPVSWSTVSMKKSVRPGQEFTVMVSAGINPGWHIYSISQASGGPTPTSITVPGKQPFALTGFVIGPVPHSAYDQNFQLETETYQQAASFKIPLIAAKTLKTGLNSVAIDVRFQACNDRICLPARTVRLNARLKVDAERTTQK